MCCFIEISGDLIDGFGRTALDALGIAKTTLLYAIIRRDHRKSSADPFLPQISIIIAGLRPDRTDW